MAVSCHIQLQAQLTTLWFFATPFVGVQHLNQVSKTPTTHTCSTYLQLCKKVLLYSLELVLDSLFHSAALQS